MWENLYITNAGLKDTLAENDSPPPLQMINTCKEWISKECILYKVARNNRGYSYEVKHELTRLTDVYVTNGAFICAAVEMGIPIVRCKRNGHNAYIAIVPPSLRWKHAGYSGFTRWLFRQEKDGRGTMISDLSNDAYQDNKWPRHGKTLSEFTAAIKERRGCKDALLTLYFAWAKYNKIWRVGEMGSQRHPTLVYIIRASNTNYYKIGKSSNLDRRLEALQSANPLELVVYASFPFSFPARLEKGTHREFVSCRHRGEWFEFTQLDSIRNWFDSLRDGIIYGAGSDQVHSSGIYQWDFGRLPMSLGKAI